MKCYECTTQTLSPTKLDFGLPALQCNSCHGMHIDLLTYRAWLEDVSDDIEEQKNDDGDSILIDELENTQKALICQRCKKFTRKYRINNDFENTINVCHSCDDVWLDKGEWELLKHLKIQDKLTEVMGTPWQNQLRTQEQDKALNEHYQKVLGEDFNKVSEFAEWLNTHPNKAQIKHYLLVQDEKV